MHSHFCEPFSYKICESPHFGNYFCTYVSFIESHSRSPISFIFFVSFIFYSFFKYHLSKLTTFFVSLNFWMIDINLPLRKVHFVSEWFLWFSKMIHKNDLQKWDSQKWFWQMIHKNDSQEWLTKWSWKMIHIKDLQK